MKAQFLADNVFDADQNYLDVKRSRRSNRAFNLGLWGMVAAHGVNRDRRHVQEFGGAPRWLLFDHLNDLAAFVFAAMRADTVRELRFVAIGALRHHDAAERIVSPARGRPAFGMSSFRIGHERLRLVITG